ncbi:hypothetical protein TcWFU_002369 [Taenia crassiceps]|uniref:Uncharacterized protein n=1 Tax=Taenia crassiceps TaxID=6207 RepID=A0ABR4QPR1_9CEST
MNLMMDPEFADLLDETPTLPRTEADEFRPFIPRLLEAKFWYYATRAIIISLLCTFFPFLDIPVFWPILVVYFILLFTVMMKRQIKHMITHRYERSSSLKWLRIRRAIFVGRLITSSIPQMALML